MPGLPGGDRSPETRPPQSLCECIRRDDRRTLVLLAEEHVRQLVAFRGAEEQQSEHRRIGAGANAIACDERKNAVVVPLSGQLLRRRSRSSLSGAFSARIAVYRARLVGKYLNTRASLTPAALAISLVVVPLKPFSAKKAAADEIRLA